MELDLNEEPLYDIEERIRRLEGVIFRARQRQRWRRGYTPIRITTFAGELLVTDNVQEEGTVQQAAVGVDVEGGMVESGNTGKRKANYLIAKALGMETNTNKAEGCTGNFFDCNVCFRMARDPVLTCCGHLFCWSCFYRLSNAYSNAKECPMCEGEVMETCIIPIYGCASVNNSDWQELKETGSGVPARPRARRIESTRQRRPLFRSRGASSNYRHTSSHQISRPFVQGASSAVNSAERPFEGLESYLHSDTEGSTRQLNPHAVNRDSNFNIAASNQSESHNQDVAATNSAAPSSISPLTRNDDANAVTDSNMQTTDSGIQITPSDPSSSSRTDVL